MSLDNDSAKTDAPPPIDRPPAVSERLWNLIDPSLRRPFIRKAALALRKGVHPEDSLRRLVKEYRQWSDSELDLAMSASPSGESIGDKSDSAPNSVADEKTRAPLQLRAPIWAFGMSGYRRSDVPVSLLGEILQYQCGYDASTAAETEWLILRAISRDPSFVLKDIDNLRLLGCALPAGVVSLIRQSVLFECECVIDDVRRRRDLGDIGALMWIDSDELIF